MDGSSLQRRTLEVKPATPEALAPYGKILGAGTGAPVGVSDFYEGAVAISAPVDFKSDDDTCLSLATLQPRAFELKYLERHFKHTQTFIPLGGKPFVAVFGAPTEGEMPDVETLEAFRFDGQAGFTMHIGTWHEFPFALEADTNMVVILRSETTRNLATENVKDNEAHGPDLDKKNLAQRTGMIFEIAV
ncbi:MAG: ureidoglycolate lyase [Rhodospirillaceae bacterium]